MYYKIIPAMTITHILYIVIISWYHTIQILCIQILQMPILEL